MPHIYGEVEKVSDIRTIANKIRRDVRKAKRESELTELHKRAMYLVTLTFGAPWRKHFKGDILTARRIAKQEFTKTAKLINKRAKQLGLAKRYDETYGE